MYKLTKHDLIQRLTDNAYIPADNKNSDYVKYLGWLAAGNTPEPAQTSEEIAAEIANAAKVKAQSRIAEIRQEMTDHLTDIAVGTPAEQGVAKATLGLLRAELALNKAKL
jgi:hypothetical protein